MIPFFNIDIYLTLKVGVDGFHGVDNFAIKYFIKTIIILKFINYIIWLILCSFLLNKSIFLIDWNQNSNLLFQLIEYVILNAHICAFGVKLLFNADNNCDVSCLSSEIS